MTRMTLLLAFATSLTLSAAAVTDEPCRGCRPVEYQVSPGIGLDFTMSYGTAAVQYRNGTLLDIAKVDGSDAYRDVMKQLAEDVQRQQRGEKAKIPPFKFDRTSAADMFDPRWPDAYDSNIVGKLVRAAMKPFANFLGAPDARAEEPLAAPDKWTEPLQEMAGALASKVIAAVPEAEKFVIISGPDAIHVNDLLISRLRLAVRLSGLEEWKYSPSSSTLVTRHLKFGAFSEDQKFSYRNARFKALYITHTETALTLTEVHSDASLRAELVKRAVFVKPTVKHTKQQYVQNVRMALQQFLRSKKDGKEHIDLEFDDITFLGSMAGQQELQEGVRSVFGDKINNAKGISKIRNMTSEDQLYAAARGAADLARFGLEKSFVVCSRNEWCPSPEPLQPVETGRVQQTGARDGLTHAEL